MCFASLRQAMQTFRRRAADAESNLHKARSGGHLIR
jgi:hypothetical protein